MGIKNGHHTSESEFVSSGQRETQYLLVRRGGGVVWWTRLRRRTRAAVLDRVFGAW